MNNKLAYGEDLQTMIKPLQVIEPTPFVIAQADLNADANIRRGSEKEFSIKKKKTRREVENFLANKDQEE
jgi:hypothetical protein